jgi:D-lactate dehydrogenase
MRIAVYSVHDFEKEYLELANKGVHELVWIPESLSPETARLSDGCNAAIVSAADQLDAETLKILSKQRVHFITTRSAGFDHIDLVFAKQLALKIGYVPDYSPGAIAEHAIMLMLALNRRLVDANERVTRHDFHLGGLTGFDMRGKTAGIIGVGRVGSAVARILSAFGCRILAYDPAPRTHKGYEVTYISLQELCAHSDIISLHLPLTDASRYMINKDLISIMKPGVMLINTSRGAVINSQDVLEAVQNGHIGHLGLDVYEKEKGIFLNDLSDKPVNDSVLQAFIDHPNVLITAHQAFLTADALRNIAETTFYNLNAWANGFRSKNELVE